MVDTGAAFTGVSEAIAAALHSEHPSWPYMVGAIGSANMAGKQFDVDNQILVLPDVSLGIFQLHDVGMVTRPAGVYEKYISQEMPAPIVGALAGNVLRQFRVELDYEHSTAYLERSDVQRTADLGCVNVILQMKDNGDILLSGTAQDGGVPETPEIRRGDRLIEVDGRRVTGLSLAALLGDLSGSIGQIKTLRVQRGACRLVVLAPIKTYPSCRQRND